MEVLILKYGLVEFACRLACWRVCEFVCLVSHTGSEAW